MALKCVWASIDENGHARGGAVGDQTGREVKTGEYYNFGQTVVIRCKDRKKAHKIANSAKYIAESNLCGYDQNNRESLFRELVKVGFDYKALTAKTETDCSALVACAVACAYGKELIPRACWTGNLEPALVKTGEFQVLTKPIKDPSYLMKGDIILNKQAHVIICLENGSKAEAYCETWIIDGTMRFRSSATTKSKYVYCMIPKGTKVKALKYGDSWILCKYNNRWGYVKRKGKIGTYCRKVTK